MASVHELITLKPRVVHTISHDAPVLEAVARMVSDDIGSLVVLRDGDPCGIFTERDFLTRVALTDRVVKSTLVREVMSPDVIFVRPDTDVGVCMALMTRLRMRHLPVLEDAALVGLISIGDIIKHLARESEYETDELMHYIRGR
ncbi:MAG TPA: CBS domain-containing protein [Polyangiaceae bacterium]